MLILLLTSCFNCPHPDALCIEIFPVEATCTSEGLTFGRKCGFCGKTLVEPEIIPMIGHQASDWIIDKEPTATEAGKKHTECMRCGIIMNEEIIPPFVQSQGLEFTLNNDGHSYSVTGIGTCKDTDIVIPSTHNDLPVTAIGFYAFSNCNSIERVFVPESVIYFDDGAFSHCLNLEYIDIPNTVINIGELAFYGCASLKSVTLTGNGLYIGEKAFYICESLGDVTINGLETFIGNTAFYCCNKLTAVTINGFDVTLGNSAFYFCEALKTVTIDGSIKMIDEFSLSNCKNLTAIYYNGTVAQWLSIEKMSHWDMNSDNYTIYCLDGEISSDGTITYYRTYSEGLEFTLNNDEQSYSVTGIGTCKDTDIVIPATHQGLPVTSIGYQAFSYCKSITSIKLSDSVTSIGSYAFQSCSSLTSIIIPDSVTSISNSAFSGCSSLTSIEVDENNEYYKSTDGNLYSKNGKTLIQYAIGKKDKSFTIPKSVTSIGNSAFYGCTSLTSVSIPDSVTSIGDDAFARCKSLRSVEISNALTSIGKYAFYACDSLASIEIPASVTSIGKYAFYACDSLASIEIPASVTSIGNYAFRGCSSLASIMVDTNNQYYQSVKGNLYTKDGKTLVQYSIGKDATSFTIPDFVECIGDGAFAGCYSLTSITISASVTSIGYNAFSGCRNIETAIFKKTTGWYVYPVAGSDGPSQEKSIASTVLSNPTTAAEYLTDDYLGYHSLTWYRK